ncbi:MAG TPA: hypothetical protein VD908_09940 [Cytophagales bacterium]|nr:hypothetical protein [Cytophagales bacterium]
MKTLLYLYLFLTIFPTFAQNESQQYKHWESGRLEWSDFQANHFESTKEKSYLSFFLSSNVKKQRVEGQKITNVATYCYIDKSSCWVDSASRTPELLLYNQVIFDIVEINRRALQNELNHLTESIYANAKVAAAWQNIGLQIKLFKTESDSGRKKDITAKWSFKLKNALEENPLNKIPDYRLAKFGYGGDLGFGSAILTGSLGEHFSNPFGMKLGLEFSYGRCVLYLQGFAGSNGVVKEINEEKYWAQDMETNYSFLNVSLGYAIVDKIKYRITPSIGIGSMATYYRGEEDALMKHKLVKSAIFLGVNVDYHFFNHLKFIPNTLWPKIRESSKWGVRGSVFIGKADFTNSMKGYSINTGLSMHILGRGIKLR